MPFFICSSSQPIHFPPSFPSVGSLQSPASSDSRDGGSRPDVHGPENLRARLRGCYASSHCWSVENGAESDLPLTERYMVTENMLKGRAISKHDLGHFFVKCLSTSEWDGKTVGVCGEYK
ncbi:hypothetical protein GOODEAATRI_018749 [Goodea atripinnis]|uniref:Uncharacterized protein n=1 Tax=Goodea atripinnis TaxID=208336 RepID=A0ABV0PZ92_9TELE